MSRFGVCSTRTSGDRQTDTRGVARISVRGVLKIFSAARARIGVGGVAFLFAHAQDLPAGVERYAVAFC